MYQTFTGSSRRPRQVNLSGRNPNPFASTASGPPAGSQQALLSAHLDRAQRQQQRAELTAAKNIQRLWRGYSDRKKAKEAWRLQWDNLYGQGASRLSYNTSEESLVAQRLLMLFYTAGNEHDVGRLLRYGTLQAETVAARVDCSGDPWPTAYLRLQDACLDALASIVKNKKTTPHTEALSQFLTFLVTQIPEESSCKSHRFYRIFGTVAHSSSLTDTIIETLVAPLRGAQVDAYKGLASELLTRPQTEALLKRLLSLADSRLLIEASAAVTKEGTFDTRQSLWLLGQSLYLVSETSRDSSISSIGPHVPTVARLLGAIADSVDLEASSVNVENHEYDALAWKDPTITKRPLNNFLKQQLVKLVDQESIRSLLVRPGGNAAESEPSAIARQDAAQELAGYALILLRVFPRRVDNIRMWLYLGPRQRDSLSGDVSAMTYFWVGARNTETFKAIYRDPRAAIDLLAAQKPSVSSWQPPASGEERVRDRSDDWRVILIFLELYTFVLKLMDDEEFLGRASKSDSQFSKTALPIADVKDLTIFLKNLGFTMHYHSQQISELIQPGQETLTQPSLRRHFGGGAIGAASDTILPDAPVHSPALAGLTGMSLGYVKGIVTGLLRMIYERDSRRSFLPKGHWLMTSRFDMTNFIQAVVAEEQSRHQIQDLEDEDGDTASDQEEASYGPFAARGIPRRSDPERRLRAQRKASRRRYLESVAPRLAILQNMPFLIPFETRVEIFREFVYLDQQKRRHGHVDPDIWRQSVMFRSGRGNPHLELQRHHAKIRRKHELEDAFEQFYDLGADLKEPIQITFVDEFDIIEAGIDGGGVTKEFLTSVTGEAFNPELGLFQANSQHLLYPNPTSVGERREVLRSSGMPESDPEHQAHITDLLRRYEFLGRIIGKCMYEGILVDVGFAGFFLLKWALTGGFAAAANESSYRANINDLRDLDEELYQGLIMLKNYPGNVEDLALSFTVTDNIPLGNGRSKNVEHALGLEGADRTVTNENRLIYISYMARYRLQVQSAPQTNAFLRGLSSIIEPSWLSMFNQSELQTLIGGAASSIDVSDLRRNTQYGGVYVIGDDRQEHPSVQLFWSVMEQFVDEDRKKVLKFVTSTPRAPLLGFGSLNPKFSIRDSGDDEARFPTTSTCVNLLKLPRYKSEAVLREKLLYAVNSGAGFDLS